MGDQAPEPRRQLLDRVLDLLQSTGRGAITVFDLDGTLLDNRPRQARIVREFGAKNGIPEMQKALPEHWTTWSLKAALARMGMPEDRIEAVYPDARAYWESRFFTGAYCVEDRPVSGAQEFLRRAISAGAHIVYVTGRPEEMRGGTLETFRRERFPQPGAGVSLLMKTSKAMHDDAWKIAVVPELRAMGEVMAAFDNEPTHLNTYKRAFPKALVVRVATEHSGRPVRLLEGVEEIPDFQFRD